MNAYVCFSCYDHPSAFASEPTLTRFLHDCLLQRESMKVDEK